VPRSFKGAAAGAASKSRKAAQLSGFSGTDGTSGTYVEPGDHGADPIAQASIPAPARSLWLVAEPRSFESLTLQPERMEGSSQGHVVLYAKEATVA
jgi:hypothetical protein